MSRQRQRRKMGLGDGKFVTDWAKQSGLTIEPGKGEKSRRQFVQKRKKHHPVKYHPHPETEKGV